MRILPLLLLAGSMVLNAAYAVPSDPERSLRLNMKNVDLPLLIGDIAAMTGNTFSIHPQVRGKISIVSPADLSRDEVFSVFTMALRSQGYAVLPVGPHSYAVIPEKKALKLTPVHEDDPIHTEVVTLSHIRAKQAEVVIRPLIEPSGYAKALEGTHFLVITGYASSIKKVRKTLAELDQDRTLTIAMPLAHIGAAEAARLVNGMRQTRPNKTYSLDVSALSATGSNTLMIHGAPEDVRRVEKVVQELDKAAAEAKTPISSILSLDHAKAADIQTILTQISGNQGKNAGKSSIAVYEPGNALIISASPDMTRELTDIALRLDQRQAQVLVEAIIVEASDSTAQELGVQMALTGGTNSLIPTLASNFVASPLSVLSLAGALLSGNSNNDDGNSNNLTNSALTQLAGRNSGTIGGAGRFNKGNGLFGIILNAVATDTNSRILSTPSILTLDNQPARILVGQEIPITTGETLSSTNSNPFRTVSREDVGVELEVTPQISSNGTIRMEVKQIVSSISGPVAASSLEIITNKREISTTILAEDGEVIVLGGLVQENKITTVSRVPLLGDIPFLGALFRNKGKEGTNTNLMVFLRPIIIRDENDAKSVTAQSVARSSMESLFDPLAPDAILDRVGAAR